MRSFTFALVALVAAACLVNAASTNRIQLEGSVQTTPSASWSMVARAPKEQTMNLFFMMRHEAADLAELERVFWAVSDPTSPEYGQHKTNAELEAMTPISQEKILAVHTFLAGASSHVDVKFNPNSDIAKITMTVADVEALFQTEISTFAHRQSKNIVLLRASAPYTVTDELAAAVTVIGDLVRLPRVDTALMVDTKAIKGGNWANGCPGLSGCAGLVTPAVIQKRYSVTGNDGMGVAGNSFSVAEFQGQYYETSDIKTFNSGCNANVTVDFLIGGNKESAGVEAELDIEYIKGVSGDIPLTVIYSDNYSLLDFVNQLSTLDPAPLVNSVSYGNDEKQQTSIGYMESCNIQFQKAGARGLSILFASGDQGVCGREGCGLTSARFKPDFPGGSPYITAVGGTDFAGDSIGDETAWSGSGGGFSDTFDIPSYQSAAVAAYKASSDANLPKSSLYNNTGRGYPDIAALGGQKAPYCVVTSGQASGVAGTSAAAPTAASVFARLNGLRLAAGKSPLGFLNPFIYQNAAAFNDVKSGNNKCSCGFFEQDGFTAITGWDPVTGVGTPDFSALAKLV